MAEDCLFCKIVAGEIPSEKVYESAQVYAFADINPVAPTHVLIVSKQHVASVGAMGEGDSGLMGEIVYAAKQIADQEGLERGFRLVTNSGPDAGQLVQHVHFHLMGGRSMTWPPG